MGGWKDRVRAAARDGAAHGRVDRECVLEQGLEPDEDMALEALHELEDLPDDSRLLRAFRRAYVVAFLGDEEE
jgi:hypothetical protein